KKILVQCRGLTHLNTNAVNDELFNMLSHNRETIVSLRLNSAVKDVYTLHRIWGVLSADCTLLEELTLSSCRNHPLDTRFLPFLIRSRLKFFAMDGIRLPDRSLAELMENLPSTVTTLCLNTRSELVNMGPLFVTAAAAVTSPSLSIRSFQPHASKLTSTLTQQLLSTCANIDCFDDGLSMSAVDLLTAPWVMSRLVKLKLTIKDVACLITATYSTPNDSFDRIIYEQLSRLVSLEDLSLGEDWNPGTSGVNRTSWIDFSLLHGMGELATLERLRRLDIRQLRGLKMSADEGPWIRDHWPALENLLVRSFHQHFIFDMHLTTYLRENRPGLRITKG
ncbi:hypothetical protein B0O80DRAFT_455628, partial [Mortierella sp. GBAus27b]